MLPKTIEMIKLSEKKILEIGTVIEWLEENQEHYNKVKRIYKALHLQDIGTEIIRLPDFSEQNKDDEQYLAFFENLKELKDHLKNEVYCKNQLEYFATIKQDEIKKNLFFQDTLKFYEDEVFSFFIDFVDDVEVSENHISVKIPSSNHFIQINPVNFNNIFKLSELFEKILY
tara:strand:+ start:32843 stop:33358 length:516 start_codon:yes stop_codon:yes gene_type:complete